MGIKILFVERRYNAMQLACNGMYILLFSSRQNAHHEFVKSVSDSQFRENTFYYPLKKGTIWKDW